MPEHLTFADAATITGGAATAWNALFNEGGLTAGQRVLIHGSAGGVGAFATQFASWKGAYVIGTASTANIDFVRSLGAEMVIDYTCTQFEKVVKDVDLVLDTVGGEILNRSWSVLSRGGTLISLLEQPSLEKAMQLGMKANRNSSFASNKDLKTIAELIAQKKIKAVIDKTFLLHEVQQAHRQSETGHGRGRIVLCIADSLGG
ncbi:NADP-dependent oxidoreductase [Brevibacillus ruminantium]|uniref:NADP-dependent oxidoreductase n=1 Tax=Brevibacillus ruminantium TaxID=2950604 RepID=A0ABY4WRV5_9BACL|nr:NADP-dependent oxidoreductase [Brevibacillus ruminantium]USG68164.1 NADP-dependent oxidoreductase [Brevibacillus ruminantium]